MSEQIEHIGRDGRSHFKVTGGNCACGWTIINDFEWEQHLKAVAEHLPASEAPKEPAMSEEKLRAALEEAIRLAEGDMPSGDYLARWRAALAESVMGQALGTPELSAHQVRDAAINIANYFTVERQGSNLVITVKIDAPKEWQP